MPEKGCPCGKVTNMNHDIMKRIASAAKRALPVLVLAVAAVLFFLYAEGYYDFTFINRPAERVPEPATTPAETEPAVTTEPVVTDEPTPTPEPEPTPEPAVIDPKTFIDANAAGAEGYYVSDGDYTYDMVIAELRVRLEATDEYSLRTRSWNRPVYEYEYENAAAELAWVPTEEAMPALEAYMGYIYADDGETVNVYDSLGRHQGTFDPYSYEFAHKRDRSGNPLFRRAYNYTVHTEDGERSATFKDFYYYNMRGGGMYASGYNNAAENRGVMADYPGYLGVSDSSLGRKCIYNQVVQQTVKGRLKSFVRTRWQLLWGGEPINDEIYYASYPFSEGLSCVADEEGVMYFVDTNGNRAFDTKRDYWSTENRRVVEQYLLPLDETTAIGCYYYDRGLVMARRQTYDYYQLEDFDIMYVMEDEYVILRRDGSLFTIPSGYKVRSYSSGIIMLERGGKYGYMDFTGAWLGTPDYDMARPFSEGLAACMKDGKWGMIDTAGNVVLPFIYDSVQSASSGVIVCHSASGWNTYLKMAK